MSVINQVVHLCSSAVLPKHGNIADQRGGGLNIALLH
jgi:hypothetical protein